MPHVFFILVRQVYNVDNRRIQPTGNKRGRKSKEDILDHVTLALRYLQHLEYLEASVLGRIPKIRCVADEDYSGSIFAVGFCLRDLLLKAVEEVCKAFNDIPNYENEVKFLELYVNGVTVVEISREHITRQIRPRALSLVAKVFANRIANIPESLTDKGRPRQSGGRIVAIG